MTKMRCAISALFPVLLLCATRDRIEEQIDEMVRLTAAAKYDAARIVAAGLLPEIEKAPLHRAAAYAWNQVALLDHVTGHHQQAERTYNRGIQALGKAGVAPPGLDLLLLNLATLYLDTGVRPALAELLSRKALKLAQANAGGEPEFAKFYCGIGWARMVQGDMEGARQYFEQALALGGTGLNDKAQRAMVEGHLGALAAVEGKALTALEHFERAAILQAEVSGPTHPDLVQFYLNMAILHHRLKHWDRAGEHASRAREIAESRLGTQHPKLPLILQVSASVLRHTGHPKEARQLEKQRSVITAGLPRDPAGAQWVHIVDLPIAQ